MITNSSTIRYNSDALIFFYTSDQIKKNQLRIDQASLRNQVKDALKSKHFAGNKGETLLLYRAKTVVILAGLGKEGNFSGTDVRIAVKGAVTHPKIAHAKTIQLAPHNSEKHTLSLITEGIMLGGYVWNRYISKKKNAPDPSKRKYTIRAAAAAPIKKAAAICQGVNLTRDLVNDNADRVNAPYLERMVKSIVRSNKKIKLTILGESQMKRKGLNLHLAVNRGSIYPPRLIIVKYSGGGKNAPYTAIIGKGITYDTGGLNLKPTGYMETMRMDMGGTASVIGTLKNICALKPKKNILFVCAIAENAIDAKSYKPGDVIKSYDGKYVEIGNTDAEGRLVLADAIAYVVKNFKPAKIIDIATLTGACVIALGYDFTGLMSNDKNFAEGLLQSAEQTDDRVWQLPIYPELKMHVKSKIADIRNVGLPRAAGTISAGEFLRQFTGKTKWAHLDIAGTAFVEGAGRMYFNFGATGASVRLLTHYLTK